MPNDCVFMCLINISAGAFMRNFMNVKLYLLNFEEDPTIRIKTYTSKKLIQRF